MAAAMGADITGTADMAEDTTGTDMVDTTGTDMADTTGTDMADTTASRTASRTWHCL